MPFRYRGLCCAGGAIALIICIRPAQAQLIQWRTSAPASQPAARRLSTAAFDAARQETLLFGGLSDLGLFSGELWGWNGSQWTLHPIAGPGSRAGAAIVYDSNRSLSVLFGGVSSLTLGDNWEWNGAGWMPRLTGPSARFLHAMAYDSARHVSVMFGGNVGGMNPLNGETWEWSGTSWAWRSSGGPMRRAGHAIAYDSGRGVTVLFGGVTDAGYSRETWEWDGAAWTMRSSTGPAARFGHAMAYDSARSVTVLFGGNNGSAILGDTWEWNGSIWTQRAVTGPAARYEGAMAYDSARQAMVLFGGAGITGGLNDTWQLVAVSDCNTNGIADLDELPGQDCNTNSTLDACELDGHDCNSNSLLDMCELAAHDCNTDGTPDGCQSGLSPHIDNPPASQMVCAGSAVRFDVTVSGDGPFGFSWLHDGVAIPGATEAALVIEAAERVDAGLYAVVVTSACGAVTSESARLSVISPMPPPAYQMKPLCMGNELGAFSSLSFTDEGVSVVACDAQRLSRMIGVRGGMTDGRVWSVQDDCTLGRFGRTLCSPQSVLVDTEGRWPLMPQPVRNLVIVGGCDTIRFLDPVTEMLVDSFHNPELNGIGQMAIGSNGRLYVGSVSGPAAYMVLGSVIEPMFPATGLSPRAVAVDGADNVYVTCAVDGVMRKLDAGGNMVSAQFASGLEGAMSQAVAPGGIFHADLFVACGDRVMEVDAQTGATSVFLGCRPGVAAVAFDADGYMYLSDLSQEQVYKIGAGLAGDENGDGVVDANDVSGFVAAVLGTGDAPLPLATADMNGDGCVDGADIPGFVSALLQ